MGQTVKENARENSVRMQIKTREQELTEELFRGTGEQLIEHVEVALASGLLDHSRFL